MGTLISTTTYMEILRHPALFNAIEHAGNVAESETLNNPTP